MRVLSTVGAAFGAVSVPRSRTPARSPSSRATSVTLDCDVLNDSDTDLKLVIHTAVPGSEDETKLKLTRVSGTHVMSTHET